MAKPAPKRPEKPEKEFDLAEIQALLDKRRQNDSTERVDEKRPSDDAAPRQPRLAAADRELTMSEIDAIRAQISQYWSVPGGAMDIENLVVRVRVYLRRDGSLERPPEIVDQGRMFLPGEEFYRTAAEAALRAVRRAEPLQNLPVEKYEQWRELVITFDPKDMVRG
jgi:colicin import membrane protein